MSEAETLLVSKARQGDDEAFTQLVEAYQIPVYRLCYRMLGGNVHDAEDAAQETFLRAYKALRRYDSKRSFATWLLSIAAHHCIDLTRKRRMKLVSLETFTGQTIPDTAPLPEKVAFQNERQREVQSLLEALNPTDRAAVVLYYWYDYSYQEIAETLSLTVSAVKSRLHRARRHLAEAWQEQRQEHPLPMEAHPHESPAL